MKILIIDDSKTMRTLLASIAREMSFATVEAEDGIDGLKRLVQNDPRDPFDIVLVDWEMPRMNGVEFIRAVRRNEDFVDLKLLMITTLTSMEQVAAALEAGASDYLMKPVTKELLADKLQILGVIDFNEERFK
jgi:two-component system chemotaxis response regulator CheY